MIDRKENNKNEWSNFGELVNADIEEAMVLLLPIPYEGTVSYGLGASKGPKAIIEASKQLELFDEETHAVWMDKIHTLPPVEVENEIPSIMVDKVVESASLFVKQGRPLIGVGGEHSISIGLIESLCAKYKDNFSVLQLDAHADLRDSYQGTGYSHACVMRRIYEMGLPCVHVGIRSLSAEEWKWLTKNRIEAKIHWAKEMVTSSRGKQARWLKRMVAELGEYVYITLDLDVLDPAYLPGTGTPEPGGIDYYDLLRILKYVCKKRKIIGADIVELAPIPGQVVSEYTAARILYKMIGYMLDGSRVR